MADKEASSSAEPELQRVMGPWLLLLFIVGDILGTGIYALTGQVAKHVGGAVWLPFLVAFGVALLTAFSYLELVTKYPKAAGAALYAHRAFGIHFVTFLIAFAVMCSGITSASTASRAFAANFSDSMGLGLGGLGVTLVGLVFMAVIAAVNFRGVGESVKINVLLTCVELTGLLIIIVIGLWAIGAGTGDLGRAFQFTSANDSDVMWAVIAGTTLAFFAMVGFEDSVNMAEECHNPVRDFPKMMLTGLGITGVIYILVSITSVALVPVGDLTNLDKGSALTQVVAAGAPDLPFDTIFPFIGLFAVANSALINMLMASRLLYGLANQDVLPRSLGRVHPTRRTPWVSITFTTLIAFGLIIFVVRLSAADGGADNIALLGGTTSLLLLCVFTVVNVALLVLRRRPVEHDHFKAPAFLPVLGALTCAYLAGPWARSEEQQRQYLIAGVLLAVGIVLWLCTWLWNRGVRAKKTGFRDVDSLSG